MESKNTDIARITLDLPKDKHRKLKSFAALHGFTMRDLLIEAIDHILKEKQDSDTEGEIVSAVFKRLGF